MISTQEKPTTESLRSEFPIHPLAAERVRLQQHVVAEGLEGNIPLLIAGIGQCSTTERDVAITKSEAVDLQTFMINNAHIMTLQRQNHWKPRTPRTDGIIPWAGMMTTHPTESFQLHAESVNTGTAICSELESAAYTERYAEGLVLGWFGARNRDATAIVEIATNHPELPIGIKNDLDGTSDWALSMVRTVNHIRSQIASPHTAPAILIHRGGTSLRSPQQWEDDLKQKIELTNGQLISDLAHGSGLAHDPESTFKKTEVGQLRALEHYIQIGEQTGLWANGLLLEASDAPSDTDPNMPHKIALDALAHIASLQHGR